MADKVSDWMFMAMLVITLSFVLGSFNGAVTSDGLSLLFALGGATAASCVVAWGSISDLETEIKKLKEAK